MREGSRGKVGEGVSERERRGREAGKRGGWRDRRMRDGERG